MSTDSNQSSRRHEEYFQEYWQDLTFVFSEEIVLHPSEQQSEPKESKTKKKKSRGNRQLQRYRAKLRKQGLNNEAIATITASRNSEVSMGTNETMIPKQAVKRKRRILSTTTGGVTTSLSEISLVQPSTKRTRSAAITTADTMIDSKSNKKPDYLKVPDHVFKKMLSTALEGTEDSMITLLDTSEKLQSARTYAQLINDLFYLRLKEDFWKYYSTMMSCSGIGSRNMSKSIRKEYNLHRIQFVTEENILKRQQTIIEQFKQIEDKLNEYKQKVMTDQTIDLLHKLSTVIPAFVRKGQHKLSTDFERKKLLLEYDVNDYRLVQAFYKLKPSENQIASAKIIWQATVDKQQNEEYLAILKQRIYTKRLPTSFNLLDHSINKHTEKMLKNPVLHTDKRATLLSQREKSISRFQNDLMTIDITTTEETIRSYVNIIANEKKKLTESVHGQVPPLPKLLVNVLNAITARQSNIVKRAELITKHKLTFFRPRSDGYGRRSVDWYHRRSNRFNTTSHILPLSPIIEVHSDLSRKQLAFLANGPKYIPVCQSRFSHLPIDTIIEREYQQLKEAFKNGFNQNCMLATDARSMEFFVAIKNLLRQLYTKKLSPRLFARARHDYQMVMSIRYIQKKRNIVIQKTDKSKVFHLASAASYHEKALQYMAKTNAYKEIESGLNPCMDHLRQVLTLIDSLMKKKAINMKIWKQYMRPNVDTVELAHLYFLPKPHKIGTPLRPIVSAMLAAATGISHFLDQVLRPLYNQVARRTTIIDSIHFIRRLEFYRDCNRLLSTTKFITFDVADLYTMIPRDGVLLILKDFLLEHTTGNGRINGMTIDTLMKMARLVLDTNCFVFENKYYQQIRGGAMGSPFTMTLANIYMLKWEQSLIEYQNVHKEFYGRYIDDVFMTTNLPLNQIYRLLDEANHKDPNIRISSSIDSKVEFLDVYVENNQGQLKTTVFHKPAAEPYIVPFSSDHPRRIHRNIIRGALYRAVRLCSDIQEFDKERLYIELKLLLNGYPPKFIAYHFKQFFEQHNAISLMEQLNNDLYVEVHHQIIHQLTRREKRQQREDIHYRRSQLLFDDTQFQQQVSSVVTKKEIHVSFTFESGPMLDFKHELDRLWKQYFHYNNSPLNNVKLKISARRNQSLGQLLIRKKPSKSLLRNDLSIEKK